MRDARRFIEDYLSHEYDPVKAKEYYERTKKLKGRNKGTGVAPATTKGVAKAVPAAAPKPVAKAAPAASNANRVAALKERLGRLNEILDLMSSRLAAAQARSGIEGVDKKADAAKKSTSTKETSKDKTASEKKADAKASAERYEKNKKGETAKGAQAVQDEIEEVQKKIAAARDELAAALAKARASSPKPKTAPKKPSKPQLERVEGGPSK